MNYVIIANSNTPSTKVPPNVSQTFTDKELLLLGMILVEMKKTRIQLNLDMWDVNNMAAYVSNYEDRITFSETLEIENNAISTMIELLKKWEVKTQ